MTNIVTNQPDLWPKQPPDVIGREVCTLSGKLPPTPDGPDKGCSTRYEYFIKGTEPQDRETLKQNIAVDKGTQKPASPNQQDNIEVKEHQVLQDQFGLYCIDCPHDGDPPTIIKM